MTSVANQTSNPQSEIRNPQSPIADSPWLWVLLFSLMGLITLVVFGRKYDGRQAIIERNYQARARVAERLTAENNSGAAGRIGDIEVQRPYATRGDKLIPLWPLGLLLGLAAVVSAVMLRRKLRDVGRAKLLDGEGAPR